MPEKLGEAVLELRTDSTKLNAGIRGAKGAAQSLSRTFSSVGKKMSTTGKSMTRNISLPLTALAGFAVKGASDFQKTMSEIVGLVGVSQKQVDSWSKDLIKMAPKLGKSPAELAKAMFFVTSAGLRGKKAMDALIESAKASVGGLGETKDIADAVTSAINAYGDANLSAGEATDVLVATVREGKLEASELASTIGTVIPVASQMGISFDQVGGAVAALTRIGFNSAESVTALQAIMSGLLKPTDDAKKALQSVGLSFSGIRQEIREQGLFAALQDINNAFDGNAVEMAKVFPNIRALRGAMGLLGENTDNTAKIMKNMAVATGSTDTAFKVANATMKQQLNESITMLKTSLVQLGNVLGPVVIPMIKSFGETIGKIATGFSNLSPGMQDFIVKAGLILAATGPVVLVIGKLVSGIGGLINIITMLAPILVTVFTGPAAPFVLAGIAVAALALLIYKNWDKIKKFTINLVTTIKTWMVDKLNAIFDKVKAVVNKVTGFFSGLYDKLVGHSLVPDMVNEIGAWLDYMVAKTDESVGKMKTSLANPGVSLPDWGGTETNENSNSQGKDAVNAMLEPLTSQLDGLAGSIATNVAKFGAMGIVVSFVQEMLSGMLTVLGPLINNALTPISNALKTIGEKLANALIPILAAITPILQILAELFASNASILLNLLQPAFSAISVVLEILKPLLIGVAIAFEVLSAPVKWVADLFSWVGKWIQTFGNNVAIAIWNIAHPFKQKGFASGPGTFSSDAFSGLAARIQNIINMGNTPGELALKSGGSTTDITGLGGGTGTVQQARPINITVYVQDNNLVGSDGFRELAIILKDEFQTLGVLGL